MKYLGKSKILIALSVVLFTIIAVSVWYYIQDTGKTATINVKYAPLSANISIDGRSGSDSNRVTPGSHEVIVSRDGFASYEETVEVADGEIETIYAVLESNSAETAGWYDEHEADAEAAQSAKDARYVKAAEEASKEFKISAILPYTGPKYSYQINYGVSETREDAQAVFITYYTDTGKEAAKQYIIDNGFSLDDYEIVYTKVRLNPVTLENEPVE